MRYPHCQRSIQGFVLRGEIPQERPPITNVNSSKLFLDNLQNQMYLVKVQNISHLLLKTTLLKAVTACAACQL